MQNLFLILTACLSLISFNGRADTINLATQPLAALTTSDVLPNVMFILDNSGSMGYDYTPDWSDASADWLFKDSAYNSQFYNPAIRYIPAVTYTGASMPVQSTWTAVFNDVTETGAVKGGTTNITSGLAYFYKTTPGEYCSDVALTSCVSASSPSASAPNPAPLRWCSSISAAVSATPASGTCQASRVDPFVYMRSPASKFFITLGSSGSMSVSRITLNNKDILSATVSSTSSTSNLTSNIISKINACTTSVSGTCDISGVYAELVTSTTIMVTVNSATFNGQSPVITKSGSRTVSATDVYSSPGSLTKVQLSSNSSYPKTPYRTDCASSTCSYSEEMTNFANWHTYYKTRLQAMKTAASLAFNPIDARYRIGYITINSYTSASNFLSISKFDSAQKKLWYAKLYAATASGSTPIRGALSNVGRMYAGLWLNGGSDPVEYSCQSNFALLTTDGYWNDSDSVAVKADGKPMSNMDSSVPRPMYEGPSASSNSLADIAKYYNDTDLRDSSLSNCGGAGGSNVCGSASQFPVQNMVTMTLGLGIDGTILYTDDYKSQTTGPFANIKNGTANWPNPASSNPAKIDDLWHAAVNGGGTYYSASNPQLLRESLVKGLQEVKAIIASGTGSSSSSLSPVQGDSLQYVATYTTSKWIGNIEAHPIDYSTLKVSQTSAWCAEDIPASTCGAGYSLQSNPSGGFYCVAPKSTDQTCSDANGVLGAGGVADSCYISVAASCTGTLKSRVSATSDSRTIYTSKSGSLVPFTLASLTASQKSAMASKIKALSQYSDYSSSQKALSDSDLTTYLIGYLRGQRGYDLTMANANESLRLFRPREGVLGDITESKPTYFKSSYLNYSDAGYASFKASTASRAGMVYVGSNDGMLHAFNAQTGSEVWAYIPESLVSELPALADRDYSVNHKNYVNGSPVITDICVSGCSGSNAVWKSVLIVGLNGGGREYFAIDVTNPTSPSFMWRISAAEYANLGYTFSNPVVTKKLSNGSYAWVVYVTTGVNNGAYSRPGVPQSPAGDGVGRLLELDAATGAIRSTISTGIGTSISPSNAMKLGTYAYNPFVDNTSNYVYLGDLSGNLWKVTTNTNDVSLVFSAKSDMGDIQPISSNIEVGTLNKSPFILFGTGKYLEISDINDTSVQAVYGLKDTGTYPISKSTLLTKSLITGASTRSVSSSSSLSGSQLGWSVPLPAGERVITDSLLINSVYLVPSMVPSGSSCLGGGYGWINYFSYSSGSSPIAGNALVSEMISGIPTGITLLYKDGKPSVSVSDHQHPTPKQITQKDVSAGSAVTGRATILKQNKNGTFGKRTRLLSM